MQFYPIYALLTVERCAKLSQVAGGKFRRYLHDMNEMGTFCSSADHGSGVADADGRVVCTVTLSFFTTAEWPSSAINFSTRSLAGRGPAVCERFSMCMVHAATHLTSAVFSP